MFIALKSVLWDCGLEYKYSLICLKITSGLLGCIPALKALNKKVGRREEKKQTNQPNRKDLF